MSLSNVTDMAATVEEIMGTTLELINGSSSMQQEQRKQQYSYFIREKNLMAKIENKSLPYHNLHGIDQNNTENWSKPRLEETRI